MSSRHLTTRLTGVLLVLISLCAATASAADYEHAYGYDLPTQIGEMNIMHSYHSMVENLGTLDDTYTVEFFYDHPSTWTVNACANGVCYPNGTPSTTLFVGAGLQEEVTVDFTPVLDAGQGFLTVRVTSQAVPANTFTQVFSLIAAPTSVLLVDDDGGEAYEDYYAQAISASGFSFGIWDLDVAGKVDATTLQNFDYVVWNVGWAFPTLDADDRAAIGGYLDNAGAFFVTGQDIGFDFYDPTGAQFGHQDWYRTYLGAEFVSDNAADLSITGVASDPIGNGLSFNITGGDGAGNQQFPSEIQPYGASYGCLEYAPGLEAGVRHTGNNFRSVYFSFGFEAIATAVDRAAVMGRVLGWLTPTPTGVNDRGPARLVLSDAPVAFPNPFNPSTLIRFDLSGEHSAAARVDVHDLAGRRIRSLFNGEMAPGTWSLEWDGRDDRGNAVSSGLYFARINVDGQSHSLKMTLAR
jgi:FlgD Ig-like domain